MDYNENMLSPKLARLRRSLILHGQRRQRQQHSLEQDTTTGSSRTPILPLKRNSAVLMRESSSSRQSDTSIDLSSLTNLVDHPQLHGTRNDVTASIEKNCPTFSHPRRTPLADMSNVHQSSHQAYDSSVGTIQEIYPDRSNGCMENLPKSYNTNNRPPIEVDIGTNNWIQWLFEIRYGTNETFLLHSRFYICISASQNATNHVRRHMWNSSSCDMPFQISDAWDAGDPVHRCLYCNASMWEDEKLSKSRRNTIPKFGLCCMDGKVELPILKMVPQTLQDLHSMNNDRARYFQKNIRKFNSMFSFTSMAGKVNHAINNGSAPPTFSLSGQNYHSIGSLIPSDNNRPRFAQLYIYDTENEVQNRVTAVSSMEASNIVDYQIVTDLKEMLDVHNPLAKTFRFARDRFAEGSNPKIKLKLIRKRDKDGRVYNLPTVSEVAILVVGDIDDSILERDIIVQFMSNKLQRIDVLHPLYLALQYPLLFPYGEDGFRVGIQTSVRYGLDANKKRKTISMREFFSYRIQMRCNESPILLQSRRLFQQFSVDAYTMIEAERLSFIRHNQPKLRVDKYNALHESLVQGEANAVSTGQRIILPSSFTGGPRYMFNNCKDAFAICKYAGYPSYFITITCNPEWDEIKRLLKDTGFKAEDRPDIVSRIFNIKLSQLIADFKQGKFFGKISGFALFADVCTVEFQKRGLPHAHILLFMNPLFKPKTPDDIDKHISAEIPDKHSRPKLYAAVEKFMVHGPCGRHNNASPCMSNGRCSKFFPKQFRSRTVIDEAGFPKYRRRDNGRTIMKKNIVLDNSYIVPYNRSLLLKYCCHINVEHTCQTSAIKYLFKYVHKGNDRVTASFYQSNEEGQLEKVIDEIRNYYDCRYISACEAVWRIFGYDIQQKEPSVIRLPFHLSDEHPVVFRDYENIVDVIDRVDGRPTKMLAWMLANRLFPFGRTLTYSQFPNKFVWKEDISLWMPRKQGFSIGRLTHVPRGSGEDYYLRLLLNIQKGCVSFVDIRTVAGVVYSTFKEACYALGLLQDDKEFVDAILEVGNWASANYIRDLFVVLLLSNNMGRPENVWQQCYNVLSEDILYFQRKSIQSVDLQLSEDQIMNLTLSKIEGKLQANGRSLREFDGMPFPSFGTIEGLDDRLIMDELNFDVDGLRNQLDTNLTNMNVDQRKAFDVIINAVNENQGGFFFVYGYGGTGKTFLYNTLSTAIRSKGEIVLNVASSGIASLLLPNGRTAHSRFKIPLDLNEDSICCIKQGTSLSKLVCRAKLIIWDEAPMLNKLCYEALDRCLRDIVRFEPYYNSELPFGGKVVVLGGDFRQILPVIPMGSRQDIVQAAINSSYLWEHCNVLRLTINMRLTVRATYTSLSDVSQFASWLLDIGDGIAGDSTDGESIVVIPDEIIIQDFDQLVDFVYPDLLVNINNTSFFKDRSILAPTLEVVNDVNSFIMQRVDADAKTYLSSDTLCLEEGNMESELDMLTPDVLNAINCSGLPPHELTLKVGLPVMLLRNIDQSNGLCNGTRLRVRRLGNHVIECITLTGGKIGQVVLIPRMNMIPNNQSLPFRFQPRQFPIIVSFVMTINKSQGQTLSTVGLYLPRPVFTHGQLYVALSRVTSKSGLRVLIQNTRSSSTNSTINVVYREVFQNIT
ncbi:uncharacterized protein [Arachis hypogaea]|uniref:uncharacterized protein n=1 Tax=Arachis hypogaea TaxID=3818 RepID=UPI000DEC063C|nr:uncharacterized protein LOC112705275 [Arachis hypogaea]